MLKQMLLKECENQRGLATKLAKIAGYKDGSGLKKMLKKDDNSDCEKVDGLLAIAKYFYQDRFNNLVLEYAKTLNPNRITARLLLEYATINRLEDVKKYLINALDNSDNNESKEWAHVYKIDDQISKGEIDEMDGLNLLNSRKYNTIESRVFSKIAQLYCYFDLKNDYKLSHLVEKLLEDSKKIKNESLRNSYVGRIFIFKTLIDLHNNKLGKLLESLFLIEDSPDPLKTNIYLHIGNAYIVKSYDKSMEYFNKALDCTNERSEHFIRESINFVSVLWDKFENYKYDGTLSNDLFYNIKIGNKRQAENLLGIIDFEKLSTSGKGFNCYYRGLLYNDKSWFFKSIKYFTDCNSKIYRQLPIIELKKFNIDESFFEAFGA
ncbi:AimR family lysis-lysogeny pheromone receptor [Heyndrickxia oleronia]|uniref:AimR family lysis-lysogeny pheromone receptor n=1 Tax=Heyndrickxia oleronia TaxID=38875 RepID=UPI003F24B821